MRCEAMDSKHRLCPYPSNGKTISGMKKLCMLHTEAFFRGETILWAPKRLLEWDLSRRLQIAVEYEALRYLNMEVDNG